MNAAKLCTIGRDAAYGQATVPGAPRQVLAGRAGGVHWTVHAGRDQTGRLSTFVTRTCGDASAMSSVPGSGPPDGQLVSMWIGREPAIPPLLLLKARPGVTRVTAVLASRDRRLVTLSPVIEDFSLRFGAAPLPGEDPLMAVEIGCWPGGTRIIELWRPPERLVLTAQAEGRESQ
jgi:hypothetical protein